MELAVVGYEMRVNQKAFFKTKGRHYLVESKRLEAAFDKLINVIIVDGKPQEQQNLFLK